MHELSIAHSLIDLASDTARAHGAERVVALSVRIGVLSGVVPRALEFVFGLAAEGTTCEGAELTIEEVPLTVDCPRCGEPKSLPQLYRFCCPDCGTATPEIRTGQELELSSIEVEDHAAAYP